MIILLDRYIKIYRLSQVSGNRTAYQTLTTTLESTIQPLSDEKAAQYGGSHGKLYIVYLDVDRNIVEGDQIRDKEGNIFKVVAGGVDNRNDGFIADYMSVTVTKLN